VLLVGFWFDGGLFNLSIGPVFWILLELGKAENFPAPAPDVFTDLERQAPKTVAVCQSGTSEIWLRRVAWSLGAMALIQTATLVSISFLPLNNVTMPAARKWLVAPAAQNDFEFLMTNMGWNGKELNALLEHVSLANYNRSLVNWQWDDSIYRQYVLTPTIEPQRDGQLAWRRPLWENFYPRIKQETDPQTAAGIVLQLLHQRLRIGGNAPFTIDEMWQKQTSSTNGVEAVSVAALRSVGIPARLGAGGQMEFFNNGTWQQPAIAP